MRLQPLAALSLLLAPGASMGLRSPGAAATEGGGHAVHLISFGSCSDDPDAGCNKRWLEDLRNLSEAAAGIPAITHHHMFNVLPAAIRTDPRWERHLGEGTRGRGYWFYKAALANLLSSDGTMKDGDVVIWCDAQAKATFSQHVRWEAMLERPLWDFFVLQQGECEHMWTKGDIFRHFGVQWSDPHYGLTPQPRAQAWIAWLNPRTRTFMRHWEDLMADFHLASDEASMSPSSPSFVMNRHDQSLLSMLVKANVPNMLTDSKMCREAETPELRSNRSSAGPWQRHKVYGIPGLVAKVGYLSQEAPDVTVVAPVRGPPVRRIFARGGWSDLDALQPAAAPRRAAPPGVDSSDE